MAETSESKQTAELKGWGEKLKLFAAIVGIISPIVALATFVGFKPEKKKSLEWEYLSINTLVNTTAASSEKIEVSYDGRKIKQLSVISARILNSGSLPVESSDVKDGAFPTIYFPTNVTVIGTQIKSKTPTDLKADIYFQTNYVRLEHGLLNPLDAIDIQILLDGDLGNISALPNVSYRIAGISAATTRFPSVPPKPVGPAYFTIPPFTEYLILVLASLPAVICILLFWVPLVTAFAACYPDRKLRKQLPEFLSEAEKESKTIDQLPIILASKLYVNLPAPVDKQAEQLATNFQVIVGESKAQYLDRFQHKLLDQLTPRTIRSRIKLIDKGDFFAGISIFIMGIASFLVLLASWYRAIKGC